VSFNVGQVVGGGVVVVAMARVSPFLDEQFHDGNMAGRGGLMEGTAMVLTLCVHQCSSAPNTSQEHVMYIHVQYMTEETVSLIGK
jgi:hypothetical protein